MRPSRSSRRDAGPRHRSRTLPDLLTTSSRIPRQRDLPDLGDFMRSSWIRGSRRSRNWWGRPWHVARHRAEKIVAMAPTLGCSEWVLEALSTPVLRCSVTWGCNEWSLSCEAIFFIIGMVIETLM
ncbi:hypothetical protein U9M48_000800 [Paspalum notatum var. saurae]|uniref:Uncharacterized protein n=1 Tax=Paspalum notatum var. saurae TaxID=547442 RepID=A0AAQ3PHF5_PASNO